MAHGSLCRVRRRSGPPALSAPLYPAFWRTSRARPGPSRVGRRAAPACPRGPARAADVMMLIGFVVFLVAVPMGRILARHPLHRHPAHRARRDAAGRNNPSCSAIDPSAPTPQAFVYVPDPSLPARVLLVALLVISVGAVGRSLATFFAFGSASACRWCCSRCWPAPADTVVLRPAPPGHRIISGVLLIGAGIDLCINRGRLLVRLLTARDHPASLALGQSKGRAWADLAAGPCRR
jgi:hypothetical protein